MVTVCGWGGVGCVWLYRDRDLGFSLRGPLSKPVCEDYTPPASSSALLSSHVRCVR